MVKREKIDKVEGIKEIFKCNSGLIFTDHSRLKAEDAVQIRERLAEANAYIKIIKNTLALIAAGEVFKGIDLTGILRGPTSIVVSNKDIVSTAKILKEFSEEFDTLKVKAGILDNRLIEPGDVERIASLPGRDVLLTDLVVSLKSPIFMLVNVLSGINRNLVIVLNQIKQKKEQNIN